MIQYPTMERRIDFKKIKDPEERAWAMIWKAAKVFQGIENPDAPMLEVIGEISKLKSEGKLTKLQQKVLIKMGENACASSEIGF